MAIQFRLRTPARRVGRKTLLHYSSYRKTLRQDFDNRCGYCGSFDKISKRSFAIDHFIPQNPSGFTHTLPANDYYNLVYSCGYCNGAKTNKWPTNDPTKPNNGKAGFIDPVDPQYDLIFQRDATGKIEIKNSSDSLAKYIHKELNLINHYHSILWKLERVDVSITKIKDLVTNQGRKDLQGALDALLLEYHNLTDSLFSH